MRGACDTPWRQVSDEILGQKAAYAIHGVN